MRLFVALTPPPELRLRLARVRDTLRQGGADVKWVETDNLHLTLKFLGEADPSALNSIQDALRRSVLRIPPFTVGFKGCGTFPDRRRPRVVWVGIDGAVATLQKLQAAVERGLEPLGFAPEARRWSPHLTLGRVRSDSHLSRLVSQVAGLEHDVFGSMPVQVVSLMESRLSPRGPTYHHLDVVPLRADAASAGDGGAT